MDTKSKKEMTEAFQELIADILDKFEKYKQKDKDQVKAFLEQMKVLNKELDKYDSFFKNLIDRSQKNLIALINALDKTITKKEQQSYARDFSSLVNDILDKYEKYSPEDKTKVENTFNALLELNKKLEDYDLNIFQKALKAFNDNFGVK